MDKCSVYEMSPQFNFEVPSSRCKKGNLASNPILILKKSDSSSSKEANFNTKLFKKIHFKQEDIIQYSEQCPQQPSKNSNKSYMAIS